MQQQKKKKEKGYEIFQKRSACSRVTISKKFLLAIVREFASIKFAEEQKISLIRSHFKHIANLYIYINWALDERERECL